MDVANYKLASTLRMEPSEKRKLDDALIPQRNLELNSKRIDSRYSTNPERELEIKVKRTTTGVKEKF